MICSNCTTDISTIDDGSRGQGCPRCGGKVLLRGEYGLLEVLKKTPQGNIFRAFRLADGTAVVINEVMSNPGEGGRPTGLDTESMEGVLESFSLDAGRHTYFYVVRRFEEGQSIELPVRGTNGMRGVILMGISGLMIALGVAAMLIVDDVDSGEVVDLVAVVPAEEAQRLEQVDNEEARISESEPMVLLEEGESESEPEVIEEEVVEEESAPNSVERAAPPPREPRRPSVAQRVPSGVGPFRLGMSLDEARQAVPNERDWRRRGRGRPMPEGESWLIQTEFVGEEMECDVYFCVDEGICSASCTIRVTFAIEDHQKVGDALIAHFQEAYGTETRYFYRDGTTERIFWWTHPEAELVLRAQTQELENIRGDQGHATKRISLESAYYRDWHEAN